MARIALVAPTYNGQRFPEEVGRGSLAEFDFPLAKILILQAGGLRFLLGTHDEEEMLGPELQLERHPAGWMVLIHPIGCGDASGVVCLLDDGRTFAKPENDEGSPRSMQFLAASTPIPSIDGPAPDREATPSGCGPLQRRHAGADRSASESSGSARQQNEIGVSEAQRQVVVQALRAEGCVIVRAEAVARLERRIYERINFGHGVPGSREFRELSDDVLDANLLEALGMLTAPTL